MVTSQLTSQAGPSRVPSVAPPSRPDTPASTSSTSRRPRKRKKQPAQTTDLPMDTPQELSGSSGSNATLVSTTDAFHEEDYIAFDFGDAPEFAESQGEDVTQDPDNGNDSPTFPRTRDNGWGAERAGRKRRVAEVDLNDGYANKKQRVDAASRRAPWAWDVDWDSCQNVAQMCVPSSRCISR